MSVTSAESLTTDAWPLTSLVLHMAMETLQGGGREENNLHKQIFSVKFPPTKTMQVEGRWKWKKRGVLVFPLDAILHPTSTSLPFKLIVRVVQVSSQLSRPLPYPLL